MSCGLEQSDSFRSLVDDMKNNKNIQEIEDVNIVPYKTAPTKTSALNLRSPERYDVLKIKQIIYVRKLLGNTSTVIDIKKILSKYTIDDIAKYKKYGESLFLNCYQYNLNLADEFNFLETLDEWDDRRLYRDLDYNRGVFELFKKDGIVKEFLEVTRGRSGENFLALLNTYKKHDGGSALVLGHGETCSFERLKELKIDNYDLIITCHDDCKLWEAFGSDFKRFIATDCDNNAHSVQCVNLMHKKGITFYHLRYMHPETPERQKYMHMMPCKPNRCVEFNVSLPCVLYTGLSAMEFAIKKGFRNIYTLGLDWSYCNSLQLQGVEQAYKYLNDTYDVVITKL